MLSLTILTEGGTKQNPQTINVINKYVKSWKLFMGKESWEIERKVEGWAEKWKTYVNKL